MIDPSRYTFDYLALKGQFNEGMRALEQSLEKSKSNNYVLNDYEIIGRRGYFNAMLGKAEEAQKLLSQAIKLGEADSHVDLTSLCWFLTINGELNFNLENFGEAIIYLDKAFKIANSNSFLAQEAYILKCYGDINRLGGMHEKALEKYNKALEYTAMLHDLWPDSYVKLSLAELELEYDNTERAKLLLTNVLLIARMDDWLVQQLHAHLLFTQLFLTEGKVFDAREHLHIARKIQNISGYFWLQERLLRLTEDLFEGR